MEVVLRCHVALSYDYMRAVAIIAVTGYTGISRRANATADDNDCGHEHPLPPLPRRTRVLTNSRPPTDG